MAENRKKRPKKTKDLFHKPSSAWNKLNAREIKGVMEYAEAYKRFLGQAKTERECIRIIERDLARRGFKPLSEAGPIKAGQRVMKNIKGRALIAAVWGNPAKPWRLIGAHVDSPRLDLKPNPLFEDGALALFQTHYYGGIKKYQWLNVPLSMHAVVHTRQGVKEFVIGEKDHEPQFVIPDIPPHLAREQMDKTARKAVEAENLRIVLGNRPLPASKETEKVKSAVLDYLHRQYQMVERDLLSADISFVPALKPVDVGFDRSLIAAYGQDDRAAVYALWSALHEVSNPQGVAVGLFVDKEEIGSDGDTGARSRLLENFTVEISRKAGSRLSSGEVLEGAAALSADVTEAINPNFRDISDPRNSSHLGGGVCVEKYGGSGGKYETNDASSEYMAWVVGLLDRRRIPWQTGEMGRLDLGGGGSIAKFFSRYGMDAIDAGPPLLSMHSTVELASKVDLYFTHRCYLEFLKA